MNRFYQNYKDNVSILDANTEERERSFAEQMKPVYYSGLIGKFIIHVISFSASVIYPAYLFEVLFNSFAIGLIVGFIALLIFVEIPKWSAVNAVFENYFFENSREVSHGIASFALVLISISIISSTFGVPLLVNRLAPEANTISIPDIENKYAMLEEKANDLFQPQIIDWTSRADEYFESNKKIDSKTGNYRLSSNKDVKQPYNKMLVAKEKAQTLLNDRLAEIELQRTEEIREAKAENKSTVESHNFKRDNAGTISMWIMIVLELSYVLIVCGMRYYKNRSKLEQTSPDETKQNNTSDIHRVGSLSNSNEPDRTDSNQSQSIVTGSDSGEPDNHTDTIQFKQGQTAKIHGKPFFPEGASVPRIWYEKEDGSFAEYSQADCLRFSKRKTGTQEFKNEMLRLADILKNHKRKTSTK